MADGERWKPWDTVPRDGTLIMALMYTGDIYVCQAVPSETVWYGLDGEAMFDEEEGGALGWVSCPEGGESWFVTLCKRAEAYAEAKQGAFHMLKDRR